MADAGKLLTDLIAATATKAATEAASTSTTTTTIYGTALADSSGGSVLVALDGQVTSEDGTNQVTLPTSPAVKRGDTVAISCVGSSSKSMTVTAVVGSGDATRDVAAATDNHFWWDADGAHVSSTGDHDLSGLNLLLTSAKLAFRKVLAELLTIDAANGVISFLGGLVTIRGVEWHRGGTDYEGVGMHSTEGTEITCDSSWDGEPARVAVGRTGPAGETGGCVYLEGQRIFAKDPSLAADGANASMAALWALLVGTDTHITSGTDAVTLYKRIATAIQPVVLFDKWDNAINAGCTLSETAADFVRLLVEFRTDDGHKGSVMVTPVTGATSVDGQVLDLTCNVFNPGSGMFVKSKAVQISGTTIGTYNSSGWWTGLWGLANGNVLGDYITIVKVTGWR